MRQLTLLFCALLVMSMLAGVGSYWVTPKETEVDQGAQSAVVLPEMKDAASWESILKQVSAYYKPPAGALSAEELEAQRQAEAKVLTLDDARIVGLVVGEQARVYVLTPNAVEPKILSVGEGWLEPWKVYTVSQDFVVWRDAQNDETITQYLFKES